MRNLYTKKRSMASSFRQLIRKFWQMMGLLSIMALTANVGLAQTAMTWTGAENNRFDNENNWDPAGSISGNNLTIPQYIDTLGNVLYPNLPVLTGSTDYTVQEITVAFDKTIPDLQGSYTVELDNDDVSLTLDNGGTIQYGSSGIIINKGHIYFNSYKRFDNVGTYMIVNGGIVEFKRYLIMRNSNDMTTGGHITMTGGIIKLNGGFHDRVNKTFNQWTITGDAVLEVAGNYGSVADDIESGWISGGDDFSILRSYDPVANLTTYSAVPSSSFLISNADRQVVVANNAGATLNMIPTKAVTTAQSLTWKYRKQGETAYTAFTDTQDSLWYTPTFTNSGVYYVICEGVDANGNTVQSQEVEFFIGSDAITIDPLFDIQYYRPGETGAKLTASFTGSATQMEWKYSTIPSGPYESFPTPATEATFVPSFDSTGNYYVVLEATINGVQHTSFELFYVVESASTGGKSLSWTGLVSNVGTDPANWSPVANTFKNSLAVSAFDSTSTTPYPVYSPTGNDTISSFFVGEGATFTIDTQDTINIRGSWQQAQGNLIIKSGVITNTGYFRLDKATGVVTLEGNSQMIIESLLMGDRTTNGGVFHLKDNSVLECINLPGRVAPDTLQSVTYLYDNAQVKYTGDQRSTVSGWIESAKIVCPEEGWEPYVLYDAENDQTILKARNANALAIEDDSKTYTTANVPTGEALTLINVDGVTSWEWKWGTNVNGPWNSFDPAATDQASFNPVFAESGTYYVVAVASDGVVTSNMKPIVVIDLGITPAEPQSIDIETNGDTLMAVIPSEFTVTTIAWFYRQQGSDEVFETGITDSIFVPNFASKGIYEIFYQVEVQDEFGVQYYLLSSSVEINVGGVGVDQIEAGSLKIYPNPTSGKFYIDALMNTDYTVEIFDLTGSSVYKESFAAETRKAVDFSGKGLYIVKVQSTEGTKIGRLVVK